MTSTSLAFGLAMSVIAVLFHLGLTWVRASASLRGRVALAMLTLPVAVVIPAICLFAGFWIAPSSGWMAVLGYALLRSFAMSRMVRS